MVLAVGYGVLFNEEDDDEPAPYGSLNGFDSTYSSVVLMHDTPSVGHATDLGCHQSALSGQHGSE
jgi:hypothetical protein